MAAEKFQIAVPDSVLQDLRERLQRTRFSGEIPGSDWDYGTNLAYLKELVEYWVNHFDWRAQERLINGFAHFKAPVDGLGVHFIRRA